MQKGFMLFELIIVMSIAALLLLSISLYSHQLFSSIELKDNTLLLSQYLQWAKSMAIATDTDILIEKINNKITTQSNKNESLTIPATLDITPISNASNTLGFKGSGNTKYAGSIILSKNHKKQKVSVDVGYGKISIK